MSHFKILNKREFEKLFGQSNRAAKVLKLVEAAFPRLTSFMSAYCLVDLCKPDPNTAKRKRWLRRSKVNPISVGDSYWGSTFRRNGLGHGSPTQRLMAAFKVDAPHLAGA